MSRKPYISRRASLQLAFRGERRAIGFDLASLGEIQFLRNVLERVAADFPDDTIWLFHHQDTAAQFNNEMPGLKGRLFHVPHAWLCRKIFRKLDLYITTEQFWPGPLGVYTIALFHGQPSKGATFYYPQSVPPRNVVAINDALFLYGPLHRQALEEHLAIRGETLPPHLSLFEIGYTKSDGLLQGRYARTQYLEGLGLDPAKKTILYAPAFNEGASMREHGVEILETLCALPQFNVIAKLAIDCLQPTTDHHATGGVDWFKTIGKLEENHKNFRLARDAEADPALAASDVLVTCISSIAFEFLALVRPVIFIDTPEFYSRCLPSLYPNDDTSTWVNRTVVNGGREFGLVVSHPRELPGAIDEVLSQPEDYPKHKKRLPDCLLYNPGKATDAAISQISSLLSQKVRSRRPREEARILLESVCNGPTIGAKLNWLLRKTLSKAKSALVSR